MFQTATTFSVNLIILVQSWKRDHEHSTYNRRWNVTNDDDKILGADHTFFRFQDKRDDDVQ